jgi:hypothetical protein
MLYQLAIALGSGLASAVLFLLPAKGSLAALAIGVLAPLPLMIATLGFGPRSAALAAATGTLVIAVVLHPYLAAAFIVSVVLPALLLGWLSQRLRHPDDVYCSLSALLLWIVGLTVAMDYAGMFAMALRYATFEAAVTDFAGRIVPMVSRVLGTEGSGAESAIDVARVMVQAMAPVAAAWGVVALAFNLWLAGRITQISGRLRRPWSDLPETLRLPRTAVYLFAATTVLALALADFGRILSSTLAAALAMAFALYGLAVIHRKTRGIGARGGVLGLLYAAIFALFPWPLVAAATAGVVDSFRSTRPGRSSKPDRSIDPN